MNLQGVQWIGRRGQRRSIGYPIFVRRPPSGGMNWYLVALMILSYWRDFKRKHVHWTGTKIVLREDEC